MTPPTTAAAAAQRATMISNSAEIERPLPSAPGGKTFGSDAVAETLRAQTIDYTLVLSRAQSLGILRIMGISLWLAEVLLKANVPPSAQHMMAGDPQIPVLGQQFANRLARSATYDFESSEYFRLIFRLRERRGDRWRYLWRLIGTPGAGDLAAVRLPETLFPLYRVVRLVRLVRKVFRM